MERHCKNALALAKYLKQHQKVAQVNYPGLEDNPNYATASRYLQNGFGGMLSLVLKGEKSQTSRFVESLKLVSHLANVGDTRTLIIQPSATTHQQLSAEDQAAAGVLPTLLRVSVGIEHIDDIILDFEQAFEKI
jgi:O-acetylhomoserine (thiol)-lyase